MLRKIGFVALSLLIHGLLFFYFSIFTSPNQRNQFEHKPIKSYVFNRKLKSASLPVQTSSSSLSEVTSVQRPRTDVTKQINTQTKISKKKGLATNTRLTNEKLTRAEKEIVSPSDNIRIGESSYIKNLNEKEFNKLSGSALREFKKPKPLLSRTGPLSTNQKLKQLSTSFAPVGSDIVVLSEFGPDETTILLGDSCFTITQTALDDKIYKGASRWSRSNGCGKYDKFDGQLQKSLDKYLKN